MSSGSTPTRQGTSSALVGVAAQLIVALAALGILVYASVREVDVLFVALAAAAVAAFLLLSALRRRSNVFSRSTDAITGLGNDAELVAKLDRRLDDPNAGPTLLLTFDLQGFKAYNDDFGRDAGNALLARLGEKLADVTAPDGTVFRRAGDEFCVIAPVGEGDAELLIEEATAALSEQGDGFRIGCSFGGVLLPYEAAESQAALKLADERLAGHRRSRQGIRTVSALVAALSERRETAPLESRVESLSVAIGGLLGVHGDRLEALARAAKLHDLGKLSIPSEILDKPGPLDEQEWDFIRQQTLVAEHILKTSPYLRGIAPVVRATHENWDGTGYPDGRMGEDIPLPARIIRVSHAFDAMLSPRSYRAALSPGKALAELEARAGTSFDPAVVRTLSALVRARDEGIRAA